MISKNRSNLIKLASCLIAFCLALGGIFMYWQYAKYHPSTEDAYLQANVVHIAPQVSGPISVIYIKNNHIIKKGQKLFDIDKDPYNIAINAAKAQLDLARQNVTSLQKAVESAKSLVIERQSELDVALKNGKRILILVKNGQVSKAKGDEIRSNIKVAQASLAAVKSQLEQAIANLGPVGKQNAIIRAAIARLNQTKLDLQHTAIVAPSGGKVVNFTARVGNMVQAGQPLFDIVGQNKWWVSTNFKETQLNRIRVGQTADIIVDMYPDNIFKGTVESISAGSGTAFSLFPPENATGNWVKVTQRISVKIVINNISTKFPLRVGSSAKVTVDTINKNHEPN